MTVQYLAVTFLTIVNFVTETISFKKPTDTTSKYILKLAGIGVLFAVASILAPQLPYLALRELVKHTFKKTYTKEQISVSVRYLKRKKFIALENQEDKIKIVLTKLGRKNLQRLSLSDITIKPTRWDGLWRLLTFDIPEDHTPARHIFRRKLKELGFFHFQRSVFISPFKCEQQINTITEILNITPYVHILLAQRFSSDKVIVKKFNL